MLLEFLVELLTLGFGLLYPLVQTLMAVDGSRKGKKDEARSKCLMHWLAAGMPLLLMPRMGLLVGLAKLCYCVWLLNDGAEVVYRRVLLPTLSRHEEVIDQRLDSVAEAAAMRVQAVHKRGMEEVKRQAVRVLKG